MMLISVHLGLIRKMLKGHPRIYNYNYKESNYWNKELACGDGHNIFEL
jgi:hypothetical protein